INRLNRCPKLARQHQRLASRTATRVNNDLKPVLRQRPQNIKSKAGVSWTQLVHIREKEINRIWSFHPTLTNYCTFALAPGSAAIRCHAHNASAEQFRRLAARSAPLHSHQAYWRLDSNTQESSLIPVCPMMVQAGHRSL